MIKLFTQLTFVLLFGLGVQAFGQDRVQYQMILDKLATSSKDFDEDVKTFYLKRLDRVQTKRELTEEQKTFYSKLIIERLGAIQDGYYDNNPDALKENIALIIKYNYTLNY